MRLSPTLDSFWFSKLLVSQSSFKLGVMETFNVVKEAISLKESLVGSKWQPSSNAFILDFFGILAFVPLVLLKNSCEEFTLFASAWNPGATDVEAPPDCNPVIPPLENTGAVEELAVSGLTPNENPVEPSCDGGTVEEGVVTGLAPKEKPDELPCGGPVDGALAVGLAPKEKPDELPCGCPAEGALAAGLAPKEKPAEPPCDGAPFTLLPPKLNIPIKLYITNIFQ